MTLYVLLVVFPLYNVLKVLGITDIEAIWCRGHCIWCCSYFQLSRDSCEMMLFGLHVGLPLYHVLELFPIVPRCLLNDAVWFACRFAFVYVVCRFGGVSPGEAI
jgi:hypothetical protein